MTKIRSKKEKGRENSGDHEIFWSFFSSFVKGNCTKIFRLKLHRAIDMGGKKFGLLVLRMWWCWISSLCEENAFFKYVCPAPLILNLSLGKSDLKHKRDWVNDFLQFVRLLAFLRRHQHGIVRDCRKCSLKFECVHHPHDISRWCSQVLCSKFHYKPMPVWNEIHFKFLGLQQFPLDVKVAWLFRFCYV